MSKTSRSFILCLVAFFPLTSLASDFSVGAASIAITPEQPLWMGGYAARKKPSEGKTHDLYAKAIAIEDAAATRCVIVTTDLLGITAELRTDVEDRVQKKWGVEPKDLMMNASHTHCGPELREHRVQRSAGGAKFAAKARLYHQQLVQKIVQVVGQAIEQSRPASLIYSYARAGFAMNRRLPTPRGVINSPYPEGPVDHRVPVLRAVDEDGQLIAVLFGYACHNTTLSFQLFCGDYAGYAQEYLQEDHPGTVALFVAGCGADQNPYPRRTLDLAKQHGRALANAVEVALETKSTMKISGRITSKLENVELQFAEPPTAAELEARIAKGGPSGDHAGRLLEQLQRVGHLQTKHEFPIQVLSIGDQLLLIALCGEAVVDYSLRLQRELQTDTRTVWVAGYSNHVFGYLASRRIVEEGGYEGATAMWYTDYPGPFDPSVEQRVIAKVKELTNRP